MGEYEIRVDEITEQALEVLLGEKECRKEAMEVVMGM
jgi:hypothetical protein